MAGASIAPRPIARPTTALHAGRGIARTARADPSAGFGDNQRVQRDASSPPTALRCGRMSIIARVPRCTDHQEARRRIDPFTVQLPQGRSFAHEGLAIRFFQSPRPPRRQSTLRMRLTYRGERTPDGTSAADTRYPAVLRVIHGPHSQGFEPTAWQFHSPQQRTSLRIPPLPSPHPSNPCRLPVPAWFAGEGGPRTDELPSAYASPAHLTSRS
jgi:hypothetical protein